MSGRPREFDDVAVVEAAMEVFWSKGYEAASAQELVECTGLGRGSLYNAFGSKQKLYHEALTRYQELGIEAQAQILNGPGPIKSRLRALMQWGIDGDLDPVKNRGCMALFAALERSGKDPKVEQISKVYVTRLEQVLCQLFTQGQRDGEVSRESSALSMARAFLSSYYGLRILGRSMPDRVFLEDVMEGTLARL
ncbi:TetR/AcrR family transcriptional regulator [Yersinia kristensenii]|uniref:TetR/AcrR family transcriptional regulator n=1 Tax=Yersinia kristensenii TaxID=28152 RepID=UPI003896B5C7